MALYLLLILRLKSGNTRHLLLPPLANTCCESRKTNRSLIAFVKALPDWELYQIDAVAVAQTLANEENVLSLHRANRYRELMGSLSPTAQQAIMTYIDTELVPGTVGYTFDFEGMAAQDPAAIAETIHFGCEHRDQLRSLRSVTLEWGQPISDSE